MDQNYKAVLKQAKFNISFILAFDYIKRNFTLKSYISIESWSPYQFAVAARTSHSFKRLYLYFPFIVMIAGVLITLHTTLGVEWWHPRVWDGRSGRGLLGNWSFGNI